MAKEEKKTSKEGLELFQKIIKASVKVKASEKRTTLKNKNTVKRMEEFKFKLQDGSVAVANEIPPGQDGMKRYLVESDDGSFDAFTYTPGGKTKDGDGITPSQQTALRQIAPQLPKS